MVIFALRNLGMSRGGTWTKVVQYQTKSKGLKRGSMENEPRKTKPCSTSIWGLWGWVKTNEITIGPLFTSRKNSYFGVPSPEIQEIGHSAITRQRVPRAFVALQQLHSDVVSHLSAENIDIEPSPTSKI